MRILMIHNYYQLRGGEDESAEQDVSLLQNHGHDVRLYSRHNDEIKSYSSLRKCFLLLEPTWSTATFREIKHVVREFRPDIVHVQNFFPLISPAVFYACAALRVPVINTLRNYRLLCPVALFFRDGNICEECLKHSVWKGTRYACYHDSCLQTAAISLMLAIHRRLKTWNRKIDLFMVLSEFSRRKFIEGGLPDDLIVVRPNFVENDPGMGGGKREGAVFVGRLSPEKGLKFLLRAWKELHEIPLTVIGDGPLGSWAEDFIRENRMDKVRLVGRYPQTDVLTALKSVHFLIMPSLCYESFGRTIIEAYAAGTPVIAARLGAMADLVEEGQTGLLFRAGDVEDFIKKVRLAFGKLDTAGDWGRQARLTFETKYSSKTAYENLIQIYEKAMTL